MAMSVMEETVIMKLTSPVKVGKILRNVEYCDGILRDRTSLRRILYWERHKSTHNVLQLVEVFLTYVPSFMSFP